MKLFLCILLTSNLYAGRLQITRPNESFSILPVITAQAQFKHTQPDPKNPELWEFNVQAGDWKISFMYDQKGEYTIVSNLKTKKNCELEKFSLNILKVWIVGNAHLLMYLDNAPGPEKYLQSYHLTDCKKNNIPNIFPLTEKNAIIKTLFESYRNVEVKSIEGSEIGVPGKRFSFLFQHLEYGKMGKSSMSIYLKNPKKNNPKDDEGLYWFDFHEMQLRAVLYHPKQMLVFTDTEMHLYNLFL